MKERIILAPGANGNELVKNLALHGVNCINLKITNASELARLALMKSGIVISEDFLGPKEECAVIAKTVVGEKYFGNSSYSDIKQISQAIKRMRCLVASGDEEKVIMEKLEKGIFVEKNQALFNVYKRYMAILEESKVLDSVSLIRKAIAECEVLDADFQVLKEYPLSPIEKALVDKVSGGLVAEVELSDLFQVQTSALKIENFKNCYGFPNEVETVIGDMYEGKKLDSCTVAVTDTGTYSQLFFDYALLYDIPVTFGCGIPIINSNPARLLVLYYHWMTDGFFSASSLNAMLFGEAFNQSKLYELFMETPEDFSWKKFCEVLGGLRLTNDKQLNDERIKSFKLAIDEEERIVRSEDERAYKDFIKKKMCIPYLEIVAEELSLPVEEFITKYSYIRKPSSTNTEKLLMQLDMCAVSAIYEELNIIRENGLEQTIDDVIMNVLEMDVCSQNSREGALHITDISGAIATLRPNIYVVGLSASKFPGAPTENYLLLDEDLKAFGKEADYMTSVGKVLNKRKTLMTLVHLASNLGSKVFVSYAGMNVSELKKDNASSMVYELFKEENGKNISSKDLEAQIIKVGYFEPAISMTREVGRAYVQGKKILGEEPSEDKMRDASAQNWNLDKTYSPSALNTFFGCPRKFMLGYILGIPEPEDNKPFEIISSKANGILAHSLMEMLANSDMSKEEFVELSGEYFDRFIAQNSPLILENVDGVRELFLEMMAIAYEMDPHREVTLKEEDVHCIHESGVKIHGLPDRVEKLDDGRYLIVDFKSGRHIEHIEDDIDTCLQIVIYAYLMEQQGLDVAGGEFRYIRLGESISCKYDDEMKGKLNDKLKLFKEYMEKGNFPVAEVGEDGENPCIFCKYGNVCGKF